MTILVMIGTVFVIIWEMFYGWTWISLNFIFKLVNFVIRFRLELMHIPLMVSIRKYQVKPHSSPRFSAAWAAVIVPRNNFFRLYQQNKSCESKIKFRQASNFYKRVLEAAKLEYANKAKESIITSQKLGSRDFWEIANSFVNKNKSAILLLFSGPELLSSASDKAKLFAENFSENSNLDDAGIPLLFFLLELIWNCIIFL